MLGYNSINIISNIPTIAAGFVCIKIDAHKSQIFNGIMSFGSNAVLVAESISHFHYGAAQQFKVGQMQGLLIKSFHGE